MQFACPAAGVWACRAFCIVLLTICGAANAAGLSVWELQTRLATEGDDTKPVIVKVLADVPDQVDEVLIDMGIDSGRNIKDGTKGKGPEFGYSGIPFVRIRKALTQANVAFLTPGLPSDRDSGLDQNWREGFLHRDDIGKVVSEARKRFPAARIYLAGYATSASSVLNMATHRLAGVDGYVIIGGYFRRHRNDSLGDIKARGLLIHARGNLCDAGPMIEARDVAEQAHWTLVEAGFPTPDAQPGCAASMHAGLGGLDGEYSKLLISWIKNQTPLPQRIGAENPAEAHIETVHMIPAGSRGIFARNTLEMTLFTPLGNGPFPLVIFNHGDVSLEPEDIRRQVRFRDMFMAREFLALGFAVAEPARPGIGRSSGIYSAYPLAYSGSSALDKGELHAREVFAAVEYLRTLPQIDADNIVLSGQSAGGFAVIVVGMTKPSPPWLKAIVDFSGGRTDSPMGKVSTALLKPMIDAFGEAGKTTQVPELWIFAENDSRYSADTIRASHVAFTQAGGQAELLLYPPSKGDGHFVYHEPEKWRDGLRQFMQRVGLVSPQRQDPVQSAPVATVR
ncbi:MAG: hypothetical protein JWL63_1317 [Rhodocyclales bacterium]|nr:hypothetical protein [Rhodocyclales bacterium]